MNPSKTEPAAPQPSPASSTDSEFEYLLQPVSSSSEEEEESEGEEEVEEEDSSQHSDDSSQREEEDNSQHSDDSSQSSASSTPSKDNNEEREASPQPASTTPMDLDTVSEESQKGCDEESGNSNPLSSDDIEEMVLSPQPPLTDLDTVHEEPEAECSHELDGGMFKLFSDIVKSLVTRVLYAAIWDHNEYLCYGCKISHPSQKHHTCLFGIPDNFLSAHYDSLKKRVLTGRFLVAASQLLDRYTISVSEEKIRGAAENILLELRDSENLEKALSEAVASWVGDSVLKIAYLQEAEKLWAGEEGELE